MRKLNLLKDFKGGWIIGHFSRSLYTSNDVEVAIMRVPKGLMADGHFHRQATEYNFIVTGKALINGEELTDGDCFVYEKGERTDVQYLEDTHLVVVKLPSLPNDKFY